MNELIWLILLKEKNNEHNISYLLLNKYGFISLNWLLEYGPNFP